MWFNQPSEQQIQEKMQVIEQARQSGSFLDPKMMDAAGQEAIKRLLKGGQVQQGQPIQAPAAAQGAPPPQQGGMPPPAAAAPPQPTVGTPQPQNIAPQQGGIWDAAEAEQKKRAMSGLPGVR